MAKHRQKRERLSETLERVALTGGHFDSMLVFLGKFELLCPRCNHAASIVSATIGMELSCGCYWYAPDRHRNRDPEAWISYRKDAA